MRNIYNLRKTKTVLSYIVYNFVFCTRYYRKLFSDELLTKRVHEMIEEICDKSGVKIIKLNIYESYIEMKVDAPPDLGPNALVTRIKNYCNKKELENEFDVIQKLPNIWTKSCLISTRALAKKTIEAYILEQKSKS